MRPLPYASGKRAVLCVTAQWKMSESVRTGVGAELHANPEWAVVSAGRQCEGAVLLGVWKALGVTGAFVGRAMEAALRCVYIQLD